MRKVLWGQNTSSCSQGKKRERNLRTRLQKEQEGSRCHFRRSVKLEQSHENRAQDIVWISKYCQFLISWLPVTCPFSVHFFAVHYCVCLFEEASKWLTERKVIEGWTIRKVMGSRWGIIFTLQNYLFVMCL